MRSLHRIRSSLLGLLIGLAGVQSAAGSLQLQSYWAQKHDRFYSGGDRAFIAEGLNFSGVGKTGGGRWGTMISPSYFLSAAHWHPNTGDTLTFYESDSTSGPSHQYAVAADGQQIYIGGTPTDLWLGKLTSPMPAEDNIATYPVLMLESEGDYVYEVMFVYGASNRVGRNAIDDIIWKDIGGGVWLRSNYFVFDLGLETSLGDDEAYVIGGDSGSASFIEVGGSLALVGIHYGNSGQSPGVARSLSYDSFVPYFVDLLNAEMEGEQITEVTPEPASLVLWGLGLSVAAVRRVRRRRAARPRG